MKKGYRRCKAPNCGKPFKPKRSTLQPTCDTFACAIEYIQSNAGKEHAARIKRGTVAAERKQKTAERKANQEYKQKHQIETIPYQHNMTKLVFNRMRVLEEKLWFAERGMEPYCISCGKTKMDWSCGHYKTVGSQGNLRYDRMNTFLQCLGNCNRHRSGNIGGTKTSIGYTKGLLVRFGREEGQRIIDYCETHTEIAEWTWQDLKKFRAECSAQIRELQKSL